MTQPSDESKEFYTACGLRMVIEQADVEVCSRFPACAPWERVEAVPADVPRRLPLRVGRAQCSADMWHLCESDLGSGRDIHHVRARLGDGAACLVLRSILPEDPGAPPRVPMLIAWGAGRVPLSDILSAAGAMAQIEGAELVRCILPLAEVAGIPDEVPHTVKERPDFWGMRLD